MYCQRDLVYFNIIELKSLDKVSMKLTGKLILQTFNDTMIHVLDDLIVV